MELSPKELKERAIEILRRRYEEQYAQLADIDERLEEYYLDLYNHSTTLKGDPEDWHNMNELLCAIKLLRLLRTYEFNHEKVREVIFDGEGEWRQDGRMWRHVKGGLRQPGRQQPQVYRWLPFQVFMLVSMYGPQTWIDTGNEAGTRDLLPTEREQDGTIWDLRRLCTHFIAFMPRKTNKTGFSAITNCEDFMRGDADAQVYCAANAQQQSKTLFQRTVDLIRQLDPQGRRIRFTATEVNWKPGQFRSATLQATSAGGKTKDGLFASRVSGDEYGSASYINNRSDMGELMNVLQSSMGPRREPMTVITTTAGNIKAGPFVDLLAQTKAELLRELDYDAGTDTPTVEGDRRMCLLLEPDRWDIEDEDHLLTAPNVRRKVNPALGIIVQNQFYDQAVIDARNDPQTRRETISKLFNVYCTDTVKEWIKPEEIRLLQQPMCIDDCLYQDGWDVFVGSDFSKGDDLNGNSYLAVRWNEQLQEVEFFADMDSYMSAEAIQESPYRALLEKWVAEGWLHSVPGKTFDPVVAVNRIIELSDKGLNFRAFGYDPYNAKTVVNAISQWLYDLELAPEQYIIPVRQNFATYNAPVAEFDYMVHRSLTNRQTGETEHCPMIHFSRNPMWPWQFGNAVLAESTDGMENHKPVKRTASAKVDNVQMLLSAIVLYDQSEWMDSRRK